MNDRLVTFSFHIMSFACISYFKFFLTPNAELALKQSIVYHVALQILCFGSRILKSCIKIMYKIFQLLVKIKELMSNILNFKVCIIFYS